MSITSTSKPFQCQYCKSKYAKESTLMVHICEQKRRALAKTDKHVVLAFETYNTFYQKTQNFHGMKTYDDFCKSPYYNAFVKFGSFVNNVKPLYPDKFILFVISSGTKLDHWCRDELYDKYVVDLIKTESVDTALERSIKHMLEWGDLNNASWNQYFLYVNLNRAMYDIKDGKISPWVVLNSNSGKLMIKRFNDEQLAAVSSVLDIPFWFTKFKHRADDAELVKTVVKESNI
jgi:hypothetical protein